MCTEKSADAVMICDVAMPSVRVALVAIPEVEFQLIHGEGTLVTNPDPARSLEFLANTRAAIRAVAVLQNVQKAPIGESR